MAQLPEHQLLKADEVFKFHCHAGISCFTDCCRQLELALTPYDVLRLKKALGLTSGRFLEQYTVIEFGPEDIHPRVYLGMVDDGQASCPFVGSEGCRVYNDRPGACRTYPLGRGASLEAQGDKAIHILIREPHCHGFAEDREQTLEQWQNDQDLQEYNHYNDEMLAIVNHPALLAGQRMNRKQADDFILCLYDLDRFREKAAAGNQKDTALLSLAIKCFIKQSFS
ncbi:MAG TPA: YkgJ family cysteine cluster protein [Desulfobacterales bacterium]|nr:YkgJ family cysteine cluster protein [Desulfobacterales bacterium]